jgi:hypothetical protein
MSQRNGELETGHLILTKSSANHSRIFTAGRQGGPYKSVGRPNFNPFTTLVAVISQLPQVLQLQPGPAKAQNILSFAHIFLPSRAEKSPRRNLTPGCPWAAAKSPTSYCFMVAYGSLSVWAFPTK